MVLAPFDGSVPKMLEVAVVVVAAAAVAAANSCE
jgi:hypothetical protein